MEIVPIGVDAKGNVDIRQLREKAAHYKDRCALRTAWPVATIQGRSHSGNSSPQLASIMQQSRSERF